MKYSIEIGKIVEGALKRDLVKVSNYTEQLIQKLESDGEVRVALKFKKILESKNIETMSPLSGVTKLVPVDSESRVSLADVVYPNENDIETVLSKENEVQINEFINNYLHADQLKAAGLEISNTLLLYGPPGCGKTNTAHMIAKKINLPIVIARLDSLISSYLGTTSKNIRMLFDFIQKTPCVLLLDEFDAIAKARDDSNELGELKRVVNSLLQNIDNISNDSLIIASTNHDKLLDTAVWRRFDYKIQIDIPTIDTIEKMIPMFIKENLLLTDKEINELAVCFYGMSGSTIEEIINKALRVAIINKEIISKNHIFNEIFLRENILDNVTDTTNVQLKKAKFLKSKNKDKKVFTLDIIGEIVGLSKSYLSGNLKED
jgi:AAA+ superfamily predicted ATPase